MILRDPVHGLISFADGPITALIDTREMQRLRRIRALGLASLAFPGGEHSRFSHALGSAHVMTRYLHRVASASDELDPRDRIGEELAQLAIAAALLHDLGHGPYSHTFEVLLPNARRHEAWTSQILLDPQTEVHRLLAEIDATAPEVVAELVHGRHPIRHLGGAVSGTFDVDRCDYLMRDSYMTGVRYGQLDIDWLLASLRLHARPNAPAQLVVDGRKGLVAVESFFLARLYMYRQVYLHKAVRSAEVLMGALFRRLVELGPQPGTPAGIRKMLRGETVSTREYLELDDHCLDQAVAAYCESSDAILSELATRLRDRRLFKSCPIRPDVPVEAVERRLHDILRRAGLPTAFGVVDRMEIRGAVGPDSLEVLEPGGRIVSLLDASAVLRGLSRETFVLARAVYPEAVAEQAQRELVEFSHQVSLEF